jgi:serine/threonine protein kinase
LLRPFGQTTKEDIENEVKAVTKICATAGNKNIIRILRHSPLPSTDYYYIDMELCDVNLAAYINPSYDRKLLVPTEELQNAKRPVVVTVRRPVSYAGYRVSIENTYTIMSHIVSGLEFLHSHRLAHRDLKPQNGNRLFEPADGSPLLP